MNINKFAKKPELLQITIDSPEIVEEYGDAITFYMKDYVDINTYFDFFRAQTEGSGSLDLVLRRIILNAEGQPALEAGTSLPVNLAVAVLSKVNENLGKLKTKSLTSTTGNQPS